MGFPRNETIALLFSVGLVGGPQAALSDPGTTIPRKTTPKAKGSKGGAKSRAGALRRFANRWLGTPYRWAGESRLGIDCSAYAREMFRNVFNVELPRSTSQQIHTGRSIPIQKRTLGKGFQPGDLFFYVDRAGVPNHVVVYVGDGMFTHSASGRGVVMEGFKALWGRRIVGRRVLVPASSGGAFEGAIPAAGPVVSVEIPCPISFRAKAIHVRRYRLEPILDMKALELDEICDWKALSEALRKRGGKASKENIGKIEKQIEWLESIEYLKDEIGRGW